MCIRDRAGIIEPGPPIGPAEQAEFLVLEPEVDGEDGEAQISEQKASEPKPAAASKAPAPKRVESAGSEAKSEPEV